MKRCSRCKLHKFKHNYAKDSSRKDGYNKYCRSCSSAIKKIRYYTAHFQEKRKAYQDKNRERIRNAQRKLEKTEKIQEYRQMYRIKNKSAILRRSNAWIKNNKGYACHKVRMRELAKSQAMPKWLSKESKEEIKAIYKVRDELNCLSEGGLHVDHIVPLRGVNVCGLHVPWNLEIIPAKLNIQKSNKLV